MKTKESVIRDMDGTVRGIAGAFKVKDLGRKSAVETKYHAIGTTMAHLSICSEESSMSACLQ